MSFHTMLMCKAQLPCLVTQAETLPCTSQRVGDGLENGSD